MMSDSPLIIENIKAGYGKVVIFEGVSFRVEPGEIRVILGGSGCGKSTLLNNILGLFKPLEGKITLLGESAEFPGEGLPPKLLRRTGVLFQNGALISSLNVGENVMLPLRMHQPDLPEKVVQEAALEFLSMVQLDRAFYKFPGELSGGMRKRAGLARALVTEPELLFCDEPSAGLDPLSSRSLDELLLELRERLGLSIVIVTHELDSIHTLCDKIIFLSNGKAIFDGSLQDALKNGPEEVQNFFARKATEDSKKSVGHPFIFRDGNLD